MTGLHHVIKKKASNGILTLESLKPNSREIAKRMIKSGELVKSRCLRGYVLNQLIERSKSE